MGMADKFALRKRALGEKVNEELKDTAQIGHSKQ